MGDTKVTIEMIKAVRERTGSGLMDCKKALLENDGDIQKACDWLREKGIAKAAKKAATRVASEGIAWVLVDGDKAAMVEVNCETDFVASNEVFRNLVKSVNEIVLRDEPKDKDEAMASKNAEGKSIHDLFLDASMKLGEKLDFRRFVVVHKQADEVFGPYVHMNGKIATLVVLKGGDSELANGVALNVCSLNPQYRTMADIPADVVAKETEIELEASRQDPKFASKPEAIQRKIVEGRVKKSIGESVLTEEPYVLDESQTVGNVLKSKNASVVATYRYAVGEGIEKPQEDFAAEVAAEAAKAAK
jgi:elongation factor Ts